MSPMLLIMTAASSHNDIRKVIYFCPFLTNNILLKHYRILTKFSNAFVAINLSTAVTDSNRRCVAFNNGR